MAINHCRQEQQDNQQRYQGIELEPNESLGSDSDDLGEEEERSEQYAEGEDEDEEDDEEDEDDRERDDGRGLDQEEEDEDFGRRQRRNDNQDFHDRRPLYHGAPLSVGESMLLILTILLHHNVNYLCLADIITVINLHCLQQN